jgi:zinc and cadmium transporter
LALAFNFASALTYPLGGTNRVPPLGDINVGMAAPFAAGNFLYIGATDLIPQLRARELRDQLIQFGAFVAGLGLLLGIAFL